MKRAMILIVLFSVLAMGATTDQKSIYYDFHFYLNGRWVNGDSGDVVRAYPAEEDTAGNGTDLSWVGGSDYRWRLTPDSTEVWQFYEITDADSVLTASRQLLMAGSAPENFISTSRAIADGIVPVSKLAPNDAARGLGDFRATDVDSVQMYALWVDSTAYVGYAGQTGYALSSLGKISLAADLDFSSGGDITALDSLAANYASITTGRVSSTFSTTGYSNIGDGGASDSSLFASKNHFDGDLIIDSAAEVFVHSDTEFHARRSQLDLRVQFTMPANVTADTVLIPGLGTREQCACRVALRASPDSTIDVYNGQEIGIWGVTPLDGGDSAIVKCGASRTFARSYWLICEWLVAFP